MKKLNFTRLMAVLLALVMLTAAFASCKGGKKDGDEETTTEEQVVPQKYAITVEAGTLEDGTTSGQFEKGAKIVLTADTLDHYKFSHWEDGSGKKLGDKKTLNVTVDEAASFKAIFTPLKYRVMIVGGMFDDEQFAKLVPYGTEITLIADEAPNGKVFHAWSDSEGNELTLQTTYSTTVSGNQTYRAVYYNNYQVSVVNGTLTNRENAKLGFFPAKTEIKLAAQNLPNLEFDCWLDSFGELVSSDKEATIIASANETYTANYKLPEAKSYWNTELAASLDSISANREAIVKNARSSDEVNLAEFFYVTDVNRNQGAGYTSALLTYLATKSGMTRLFVGGDIASAGSDAATAQTEIRSFYEGLGSSLEVFTTLGDHDKVLDDETAYNEMIKRVADIEDGRTEEGNPNVSYWDDFDAKIRYLQMYFDGANETVIDESLDWAEAKLMELDEGWSIVFFTHGYWEVVPGIDGNEKSGDVCNTAKRIANRLLKIQKRSNANVICWLVGGAGADYVEWKLNSAGDQCVKVIAMNTDSYQMSNSTPGGLAMTAGTETEHCINCIQIDTVTKDIYVTRVGAGEDMKTSYYGAAGVNFVNAMLQTGTTSSTSGFAVLDLGSTVTLKAANVPDGYRLAYWTDATGEKLLDAEEAVVTADTCQVTIDGANTYTAWYSYDLLANSEWAQGGFGKGASTQTAAPKAQIFTSAPFQASAGDVMSWEFVTIPDTQNNGRDTFVLDAIIGTEVAEPVGDIFADYENVENTEYTKTGKVTIAEDAALFVQFRNTIATYTGRDADGKGTTFDNEFTVADLSAFIEDGTITDLTVYTAGLPIVSFAPTLNVTVKNGTFEGMPWLGNEITLHLNRVPDEYTFVAWKSAAGETISTDEDAVIILTEENTTFIAFFNYDSAETDDLPDYVKIQVVSGTVNGEAEIECFTGTAITVTAAERDGYVFAYWTDAAGTQLDKKATFEIDVTAAETYTAHYNLDPVVSGDDEPAGDDLDEY